MAKIAIFGGTFDPVHRAHALIAKLAVEKFNLEKIIFVIAYVPPHKTKTYADIKDRSEMLKLAIADLPRTEVSFFEADQKRAVYSYQTLDHFQALYPNDEIFMIIGSDSLKTLCEWKNIDYIAKKYRFIVAKRPKVKIPEGVKYSDSCIFMDADIHDISSTEIRDMIKADNGKVTKSLDGKVYEYIKEHGLYE